MATEPHDVISVGNAMVDILRRCDSATLARFGSTPGAMRLVDHSRQIADMCASLRGGIDVAGGSAANTAVGIASLGGKAAFVGRIAEDQFGRTFRHDIRGMGVTFTTPATVLDGKETSHALILITPDGQRTMHAFVGCSAEIDAALLDAPTIAAAKILYLEGYLFDSPRAVSAFQLWSAMAKSAGRRVALALSDAGCVARHRAEFRDFIAVGVDILIANEREVMALYDTLTFDEAVLKANQDVALAVLTRSGSDTVVADKGAVITLPIERVSKVVDATGAGDLYASGLLYGLSHGMSIRDAGRLGAFAASEIIGQVGARPEARLGNLARMRGLFERRSA